MILNADEKREAIAKALSELTDEESSRFLVGFVVVSEWMDEDGRKWLSRIDSNAGGDPLVDWQREGYLHNALNGDWEDDE